MEFFTVFIQKNMEEANMGVLAINGGTPIRTDVYPTWPQIDDRQRALLIQTYNSGIWGIGGERVKELTQKMNTFLGVPYGVAISNGTIALEISLRALGIGTADEVIVPDYTFISTASSVVMVGATPVFCDVELKSFNISPKAIEGCITTKTKAIIVVHVGGLACDMEKICKIAKKYKLYVIEDCAHSIGAFYQGKALGTIGDIGTFSFQSSKLISCGEGGYICTKNKDYFRKLSALSNCGRDIENNFWYKHQYVGTNARMSEFQASILTTQIDGISELINRIRVNVGYLNRFLRTRELLWPREQEQAESNYYIYGCLYHGDKLYGIKRKLFIRALRAEGIPVSEGYISLCQQECFSYLNTSHTACDNSLVLQLKRALWFDFSLFTGEKKGVIDIMDAIEKIESNFLELRQLGHLQ